MKNYSLLLILLLLVTACKDDKTKDTATLDEVKSPQDYFDWSGANVYFMLTDRFKNGDLKNDSIISRDKPTGTLRGFKGGDFAGIIEKIDDGYFTELGVNVLWMTPVWEQVHGGVNEGTGYSYAFHG
ncbi:MAG: alpha-amylase family glycosyl hydrolase, partial [Nonlabens sp.]